MSGPGLEIKTSERSTQPQLRLGQASGGVRAYRLPGFLVFKLSHRKSWRATINSSETLQIYTIMLYFFAFRLIFFFN